MRRLFVDKIAERVVIEGDDHEHLSRVLRARTGDEVVLCPQDGYDYTAVIQSIGKTQTVCTVTEKHENLLEPRTQVSFFIAVPKGDKLEFAAQKLTELGVREIYPFVSEYIAARPDSVRVPRLQKIASEAAKQCGRGILPDIHGVIGFDGMLKAAAQFPLIVFPYENAVQPDIKTFLRGQKLPEKIAVIIGSEGGFSPQEAERISDAGGVPITLGKRILRAETAYAAVMSAVMYEAGELA